MLRTWRTKMNRYMYKGIIRVTLPQIWAHFNLGAYSSGKGLSMHESVLRAGGIAANKGRQHDQITGKVTMKDSIYHIYDLAEFESKFEYKESPRPLTLEQRVARLEQLLNLGQ